MLNVLKFDLSSLLVNHIYEINFVVCNLSGRIFLLVIFVDLIMFLFVIFIFEIILPVIVETLNGTVPVVI